MPIQPGDLSAISTAAAVAGTGYTFSISLFCVLSMGFTAIAMLLCEYAGLVAPHRQRVPPTPSASCSPTCSWRCCAWAA